MKKREQLVQELSRLSRPLPEITKELGEYQWDCDDELYFTTCDDVVSVLEKYKSEKITKDQLQAWASSLEMREDLGFEEKDEKKIWEVIFCLANPEINYPITKDLVETFVKNLKDEAYQVD